MEKAEKKNILVLGGGIMGIAAAYQLLSLPGRPYSVTIVSEFFTPGTVSDKSVGLWGPYLPGVDKTTKDYEKILRWGKETKTELWRLMHENLYNEYGIYVAQNWLLSSENAFPPEACPYSSIVDDLRVVNGTLSMGKYTSGLRYSSPQLVPYKFLKHLTEQVAALGANMIRQRISNIQGLVDELGWRVDAIVNCLGLGSCELLGDKNMHPVRGILIKYPVVPKYLLMAYEALDGEGDAITYIMFRPDCTILGGTAIIGDYTKQNRPEEIRAVIDRCTKLIPELANYEMQSDWSGLRPGRTFVRLEIEHGLVKSSSGAKIPVVHNYGHGGAGWSLYHGCTKDVLSLLNTHFNGAKL